MKNQNVDKYKSNEDLYENPEQEWEEQETNAEYYRDPIVHDPVLEKREDFDSENDSPEFE